MMSPGSSTVYWLRWWTSVVAEKIMSSVVESWRRSPLTDRRSPSPDPSPTSSVVTSQGPSGLKVSQLLPLDHWPPLTSNWKARSDTSWLTVKPAMYASASSTESR